MTWSKGDDADRQQGVMTPFQSSLDADWPSLTPLTPSGEPDLPWPISMMRLSCSLFPFTHSHSLEQSEHGGHRVRENSEHEWTWRYGGHELLWPYRRRSILLYCHLHDEDFLLSLICFTHSLSLSCSHKSWPAHTGYMYHFNSKNTNHTYTLKTKSLSSKW